MRIQNEELFDRNDAWKIGNAEGTLVYIYMRRVGGNQEREATKV